MNILILSDIHYNQSDLLNVMVVAFLKLLRSDYDIDIILIAGDTATSYGVEDNEDFFNIYSKIFKGIPTIWTFGNHDLWNIDSKQTVIDIIKKYNVNYLDPKIPFIKDNIAIAAFDSWYWHSTAMGTNDYRNIDLSKDLLYSKQSDNDFLDAILALKDLKNINSEMFTILLTHMPVYNWHDYPIYFGANIKYLDYLDPVDLLVYGHTHRFNDLLKSNTRHLNCGSGYDEPKALIYNTETKNINLI